MIRRLTLALTASIVAFCAQAAPIELREQIQSRERELVNVMFSNYLSDRVGASVQTAVVDMDGDGVGEIISRFVHTSSCDAQMERCRTTISRFADGKWAVIFDRYAKKIDEVFPRRRAAQTSVVLPGPIVVDGQKWEWSPFSKSYSPNADTNWTAVEWVEVPSSQIASYASFFGETTAKLLADSRGGRISYAKTPISKAKDTVLLKLEGEAVCGMRSGCPIRVIKQKDGKWETILSTTAMKDVSRVVTERDGLNDIAMSTSLGFAVFGWNGNNYSIADRIESNRKRER